MTMKQRRSALTRRICRLQGRLCALYACREKDDLTRREIASLETRLLVLCGA